VSYKILEEVVMLSSLPMDDNEQIQINSDQNLNQDEEIKKNIICYYINVVFNQNNFRRGNK
jgi:hypothetical protein